MPYLTRKSKTMKVDRPCHEKENVRITKCSRKMGSAWKKKKRATKGDMAEFSGEWGERLGMDFGHGALDVGRQTEMEILGEGLICSMHEGDYVS